MRLKSPAHRTFGAPHRSRRDRPYANRAGLVVCGMQRGESDVALRMSSDPVSTTGCSIDHGAWVRQWTSGFWKARRCQRQSTANGPASKAHRRELRLARELHLGERAWDRGRALEVRHGRADPCVVEAQDYAQYAAQTDETQCS